MRVQVVARAVGVSDATVHYHFENREGLLEALLRDVGRRMQGDFAEVARGWGPSGVDVRSLVEVLDDKYRSRGFARLSAWMHLSGWRSTGSGMFRPYAEALHAAQVERAAEHGSSAGELEDALHVVALLNLVTWADALVGPEWRRSVGLPATAKATDRFREWFADLVQEHVDREPSS